MKKTFRTLLAGALALFAVSCYDDSALREDIADLDERLTAVEATLNAKVNGIANLATRLSDLEGSVAVLDGKMTGVLSRLDAIDGTADGVIKDLETAIAALQEADKTFKAEDAKLAAEVAKIAVTKVEEGINDVVLTLADGTKVTLSKPASNVDNNGLVTVVKGEDGKDYWAVVDAYGHANSLGVSVAHPIKDFGFKMTDDGELQFTVDGSTYYSTGVKTTDLTGQDFLITDVKNNETNVVIKIGDAEYTLPKFGVTDAVIKLSRTNFFLRYSAEKTIDITSENLSELYIISKPDGWKAVIVDNKLTVTSPTKKAVAADAAEAEGLVILHACDADGKCVIAKLEVSTGKGLAIEADNNGNLVISNSYTSVTVDRWSGEEFFGFANYYVGIVADSLFTPDPKAYLQPLRDEYYLEAGSYGMMYNRWDIEFQPYEEGVYETDVVKTSVAEIYNWLTYSDLPYGEANVVWVAPADDKGIVMLDEVEYISYTSFKADVQVNSLTHKSGVAKLDVAGATKFYVQLIDASFEQHGADLKTYMNEGGLWMYLQQPQYLEYYEGTVLEDGTYSLDLSKLNYGEPLNFNTKYYLVVFPYVEGTVYTDFDAQLMPYVHTLNTLPLQAGGTAAAVISDKVLNYSSVGATINVGEGVDMVYYCFYEPEYFASLEDAGNAAVVEALFADCYSPLTSSQTVDETYLDAGTTLILATLAVGADGKYGEVVTESLSTLAVPTEPNTAHTVVFGEAVTDYSSVRVNVAPAADVVAYYNFMSEASIANYATDADLVAYLVTRESTSEAMDLTKNYMAAGDQITLVVVAVGEDNKYNLYKKVYETKSYPYSEAITVALDGKMTWDADTKTVKATFSVTGTTKLAVATGYSGGLNSFVGNVVNNAAKGTYSTYKFVDVVDGKATVEFTKLYGDYMVVMAAGYIVEGDEVKAISQNSLELIISQNI